MAGGDGGAGGSDGGEVAAPEVRPELDQELPDQIALQLVAELRAGRLPAGRRLPGVRRMAAAVGVHRETARGAYGRLRAGGWVTVRPGSGAYVSPALEPGGALDGDPVRRLLVRARREGASREQLAGVLERWRVALERRRVLVVGPDAATARVWAAELGADLAGLGVAVESRTLASTLPVSILAAAPPELGELLDTLPGCSELFALRPGPGPELRRLFEELPYGSVVAVLSASERIRDEVARYAAVLRGGEVAVVGAQADGEGLERALLVARFVLADVTCRGRSIALPPEVEARCFRHLDRATARALAAYLGPGERAARDRPRRSR